MCVVSFCLATIFSVFGGIFSLKTDVVVAESETIQATDFVHTSVATENVTRDANGLRISSNEAYKATFTAVFTGNTTLKFKFPETYQNDLGFYGDFKLRISDVENENNFFDIIYYVQSATEFRTAPSVCWGDEIRMANQTGSSFYNEQNTDLTAFKFAPCFLTKSDMTDTGDPRGKGRDGTREGILSLVWQNDVLYVLASSNNAENALYMARIAAFDNTYDTTAVNNGFSQTSWGLPKLSFPNGYTITVSSHFQADNVDDQATDVLFTSIETNGTTSVDITQSSNVALSSLKMNYGAKYNFTLASYFTKDSNVQAYDDTFEFLTAAQPVAGKLFLGWKNTVTDKLYPAYSVVKKQADGDYDPLFLGFDSLDGASVRIDTSEYGQSGIRFQTLFDVEDYEAAKGFIQSFGTIVAWTDTLTKGDFVIENYHGDFAFAQVQNTKGTFEYTDQNGKTYTAYSMAVYVDPDHFTKEYSARGYFVVAYADDSRKTFYTDYNATDNSRWIAQVAYQFKMNNPDVYNAMSRSQKNVIDAYVTSYLEAVDGVLG